MALQECMNGHLYDTDQYMSCPYCQGDGNRTNFGAGADSFGAPGYGMPDNGYGIPKTMGAGMPDYGQMAPMMPDQGYIADQGPMMPATAFSVATQSSIGKTVPSSEFVKEKKQEEDTGKTVAVFPKKNSYEPVVGWLVCVEGNEKGKDYKFYAKANTIGRNESNDICIKGDTTISREHHAKIAYDVKHNSYYLIPGEATNTIYLNDDPVYATVQINSYDVIELGEGKYLVITLCNKKFNWESGIDSGLDI